MDGCHIHGYILYAWLYIPRKLQKKYMFHATGKHGPHKHVTGMHCSFLVAPCVHTYVKKKLHTYLSGTVCSYRLLQVNLESALYMMCVYVHVSVCVCMHTCMCGVRLCLYVYFIGKKYLAVKN